MKYVIMKQRGWLLPNCRTSINRPLRFIHLIFFSVIRQCKYTSALIWLDFPQSSWSCEQITSLLPSLLIFVDTSSVMFTDGYDLKTMIWQTHYNRNFPIAHVVYNTEFHTARQRFGQNWIYNTQIYKHCEYVCFCPTLEFHVVDHFTTRQRVLSSFRNWPPIDHCSSPSIQFKNARFVIYYC